MSDATEKLLIPAEFYFQASIAIRYVDQLEQTIRQQQHPAGLTPLPHLSFSEQEFQHEIALGWNDAGLALQLTLNGKSSWKAPKYKLNPMSGDFLEIFLDTRDLKTNHRPTRFCHSFLMTIDEKASSPLQVIPLGLQGAGNSSLEKMTFDIPGHYSSTTKQTRATFWLAQENLFGYDPENVSSLGFYYRLLRSTVGDFYFGPSGSFPYNSDPSLWPSLKLVR